MSKILFTDAQVKKLSKNKWIKNITNKAMALLKPWLFVFKESLFTTWCSSQVEMVLK
jgi:hypothetical protein